MARSRLGRQAGWFWILVAVGVIVVSQGLLAAATHDDACGYPEAPKTWQVFPPGWKCKSHF